MQKLIVRAAVAAALSLSLAPVLATAPSASAQPPLAAAAVAPAPAAAPAPGAVSPVHQHRFDIDYPEVAPGQERADFEAWVARSPVRQAEVREFGAYLAAHGVDDVLPVWQLVRTSSSFSECGAEGFEVAPRDKWAHIVETLQFVQQEVVPAIGPVQAVSGYRNERLNRCSNGAPQSAHRNFFALDLMPVNGNVSRGELVREVCTAHARDGRGFDTGLGFYNGLRFHVDSNGFRRWGPDGRGATSPCARYS